MITKVKIKKKRFQFNKSHLQKPTANIIYNGESKKCCLHKSWIKAKYMLTTSIQYHTGCPSQ